MGLKPTEILKLQLPVTVRVRMTKWTNFKGGLRGYQFAKGEAERTLTRQFQLMDLKRFCIISSQLDVTVVEAQACELAEPAVPEEISTDETAVVETVESESMSEVPLELDDVGLLDDKTEECPEAAVVSGDELDELDRSDLKQILKEEHILFKVNRRSDDEIRKAIRKARGRK